ncbi:MAG: hypothetical protein ACI3YH_04450 [Eubacteriales bacterium]
MSYDLHLYLKATPTLTPAAFAEICGQFGLTAECCPDFTPDGTLSPLCVKFGGVMDGDACDYLAAVEVSCSQISEPRAFSLPGAKKKWWQLRAPKGETVEIPAKSEAISFSCGIDSLEIPLALLLSYAMAGEDGLLYDPQTDRCFIGQAAIAAEVTHALNLLKNTPADRLYLHEFTEWL